MAGISLKNSILLIYHLFIYLSIYLFTFFQLSYRVSYLQNKKNNSKDSLWLALANIGQHKKQRSLL